MTENFQLNFEKTQNHQYNHKQLQKKTELLKTQKL